MGLKEKRKLVGATQFEVARDADISYSRVVNHENGIKPLKTGEVRKIEKVLARRAQKAFDALA
jgi:predicted transcriptional regulator